ncbi:MAG: hypothetical protein M1819_003478 [Sarea resinae]|nr:MAG: hypothetical protein M1819_003478 [Sarea resinae]
MEKETSADPFLPSEISDETSDSPSRDPEGDYGLKRRRNPYRYFQYLGLCLLGLGWIVAFVLILRHPLADPHPNSPLPRELYNTVKRTFHMDGRYVGPSEMANDYWQGLIAGRHSPRLNNIGNSSRLLTRRYRKGHDVLYVSDDDKERYGLPQGMLSPFLHPNRDPAPQNFYVLSVMHQMHCLNHVRAHYWQLKTGGPSHPNYTEAKWDVHIDHCFEYLRQSTLCGHAIFEIEGYTPLFVEGEGVATTVSGWGLEHTCIDYDAIYNYQVNQEKEYNRTWQMG